MIYGIPRQASGVQVDPKRGWAPVSYSLLPLACRRRTHARIHALLGILTSAAIPVRVGSFAEHRPFPGASRGPGVEYEASRESVMSLD